MKKTLTGMVISNKMIKTAIVEVERLLEHAKYRRKYRMHKKYKAETEGIEVKVGDKVMIEETKPLSKDKNWKVIKVLASKDSEEAGEIKEEIEELGKKEEKAETPSEKKE